MEQAEGKATTQATEEEVLGDGGIGIGKRPAAGGADAVTQTVVDIKRLEAEDQTTLAGIDPTGDAPSDCLKRTRSTELINVGALAAPAKKKKKTLVVRLEKEFIESKMSRRPPRPYPRMSDAVIEWRERRYGCPGEIRAMEDEMTALFQKDMERYAEMCRQYHLQGYAELEVTDDEKDYGEEWKEWPEFKELGLIIEDSPKIDAA